MVILDRLYSIVVCVGLGDLEKKEERGDSTSMYLSARITVRLRPAMPIV